MLDVSVTLVSISLVTGYLVKCTARSVSPVVVIVNSL
jgi:hypothetical protein